MPEPTEPDTKTVRIAALIANRLQTITALKKEMGKKFSAVDFLNALLERPVAELHTKTRAEYDKFQDDAAKSKKRTEDKS